MSGILYMLRPQDGGPVATVAGQDQRGEPAAEGPSDPNSELMQYARAMRGQTLRAPPAEADELRQVLVLSADPSRYAFLAGLAQRNHAQIYCTELPAECADWLTHKAPVCAAVLAEVELGEFGNGYRSAEAFRVLGYSGPMLLVMTRSTPMAADRAYARMRGADEIVQFHEVALERWVGKALEMANVAPEVARMRAEVVPRNESEKRYPPWVAVVIRELVYHLGPTGGDLVRQEYQTIQERYHTEPEAEVVIESLGESLAAQVPDWDDMRREFVRTTLAAVKGAKK